MSSSLADAHLALARLHSQRQATINAIDAEIAAAQTVVDNMICDQFRYIDRCIRFTGKFPSADITCEDIISEAHEKHFNNLVKEYYSLCNIRQLTLLKFIESKPEFTVCVFGRKLYQEALRYKITFRAQTVRKYQKGFSLDLTVEELQKHIMIVQT